MRVAADVRGERKTSRDFTFMAFCNHGCKFNGTQFLLSRAQRAREPAATNTKLDEQRADTRRALRTGRSSRCSILSAASHRSHRSQRVVATVTVMLHAHAGVRQTSMGPTSVRRAASLRSRVHAFATVTARTRPRCWRTRAARSVRGSASKQRTTSEM